jgi:CRP-like cAMP-binding protein
VGTPTTTSLLEHAPELERTLRSDRRAEARRGARVSVTSVPRGPWRAPIADGDTCLYGALVLAGLASRAVVIDHVAAAELLGPGDLVLPEGEPTATLLSATVRWEVLEPLTIALLDERFLMSVRRWPELVAGLFERVASRSAGQSVHRALSQLPRAEDRVHALLCLLADRWGRVTPDGVALELTLTHETLGTLVGAKRPTVSLALEQLQADGRVLRRADGGWLLPHAG